MLRKQLEIIGVPLWPAWSPQCAVPLVAPPLPGQAPLLRIFCEVSDGGSDQMKCRRIIKCEIAAEPTTLFLDINCMMHNMQLDYKVGLLLIDEWLLANAKDFTYFGTVAKVALLWRDSCRRVFVVWKVMFGSVSAVRHALRLVPRAVAGRWGSLSTVEEHFVAAGRGNLVPVLNAVLTSKKDIAAAVREDANAAALAPGDVDEIAVEEVHAYKTKMGRWRKQALAGINDSAFWIVLLIARQVHCFADHFLSFLKKRRSPETLDKHGECISELVCGRADSFALEAETILDHDWTACIIDAGDIEISELWVLILNLTLCQAAAFDRRVRKPLSRHSACIICHLLPSRAIAS